MKGKGQGLFSEFSEKSLNSDPIVHLPTLFLNIDIAAPIAWCIS